MKALSLTQPWATLVAIGAKRIETRSWGTSYRGPLVIHAAKGWKREDQELCFAAPFFEYLSAEYRRFEPDLLPRGVIVAVATLKRVSPTIGLLERTTPTGGWLIDDRERAFGNYGPGRYAWFLANVRSLAEPIPCRGALGLWTPPADVLAQLDGLVTS